MFHPLQGTVGQIFSNQNFFLGYLYSFPTIKLIVIAKFNKEPKFGEKKIKKKFSFLNRPFIEVADFENAITNHYEIIPDSKKIL